MVPKVPTVYDVASLAGVSIATVSRVFRKPDEVTAATRAVVQAAVKELGYVPSGSARSLAARRAGAIGLCFPDFDGIDDLGSIPYSEGHVPLAPDPPAEFEPTGDLYTSEVMRGVQLEAWRFGTAVTVAVASGERGAHVFDDLAGRVDGLITLSRTIPDDLLAHIARRIPVVVVAGPRAGDDYDHVTVDNTGGMATLATHLVADHDVHDLAFVGGPQNSPDDAARFAGYRRALSTAGLPLPDAPLVRGDFTRRGGRALGRTLVAAGDLPGALVCANDQTALGVLDALTEAGVRVPHDVVVTGFDGIDASLLSHPRLTTVRQPMLELGRAAVDLLSLRIADPRRTPQARVLAVEVLLRESCGCLPGQNP